MARERYFPKSENDTCILTKYIAAEILLGIANLETEAKSNIFLSKLKQDIEKMT